MIDLLVKFAGEREVEWGRLLTNEQELLREVCR